MAAQIEEGLRIARLFFNYDSNPAMIM